MELNEEDGSVKVQLSIPFTKLCFGGKQKIKDLEGNEMTIKIPKGINSGNSIRIQNKGIPKEPSSDERGNLLFIVLPETPKNISQEQQKLLEELEKVGL